MNLLDHTRKGKDDPDADVLGDVHMLMFGDFKQCLGRVVLVRVKCVM